jgi:hypothetical protein
MWQPLFLLLAALTIPLGSAGPRSAPMRVPIEILGADGMIVSRTLALEPDQSRSVNSLWLRVHGVRYAKQASIQVNDSPWIPLNMTPRLSPSPAEHLAESEATSLCWR